jgi:uncharacterized membrane protein YraQ (UPF0718 family)
MNPAQIIGGILVALMAAVLAWDARRWWQARRQGTTACYVPDNLAHRRRIARVVLGLSIIFFLDCTLCKLTNGQVSLIVSVENLFPQGTGRTIFTETLWLSLYTLPVFFLGAFIGGWLGRAIERGVLRPPSNMVGASLWAALLPLCSCAAAPVARSLSHEGKRRSALAFLIVAPVLSPLVIMMAWGVLGWKYLLVRIAVTFGLALVLAPLLALISAPPSPFLQTGGPGCARQGCKCGGGEPTALLEGWNLALQLHPYILMGLLLGALVSAYLPEELVQQASQSSWGLLAVTAMGLPLYICTGEEIPILQPLIDMGLPLGHAIAFTVTGNSICLTSYLLLIPLFGRRVALGLMGGLLVGSYLAGWLVNVLL